MGQAQGQGLSEHPEEGVDDSHGMVFQVAEKLHKLPHEVLESDGLLFMQYVSWASGKARGRAIKLGLD